MCLGLGGLGPSVTPGVRRCQVDGDGRSEAGLRALPSLQRLLEAAEGVALIAAHGRGAVAGALRAVLVEARTGFVRGKGLPDTRMLLAGAGAMLQAEAGAGIRRVINATGIALHTNLGRAPLAAEAVAAAVAAAGCCTLEFDLEAGVRGLRLRGVEPLLVRLTGAEAAVAVNNNAAAVLLALGALAAGGEVIVSRGELVEIGGGFRIPDVIRQCGAVLVEVGTTNRTRLEDYAAAVTDRTRMLLKIHPSNYRIVGFTAETSIKELAGLARDRGLVVMADVGSGTLAELPGRAREATVREAVADGADLVAFSGDKLLGGPQAGLIVGRGAVIEPLRRHPLMRAVRLDKMTLAALEATLRLHADPAAAGRIPALRMLGQTEAVLQARAERLLARLEGVDARMEVTEGEAGAGSLPGAVVVSRGVTVGGAGIDGLARRLRLGEPAVVGRVARGRLVLDMLAVGDEEVEDVAAAVRRALG